jgi:hypothetical protein
VSPRYVLRRHFDGSYALRTGGLPRAWWDATGARVARLDMAARAAGAVAIDPVPALCTAAICPAVDADVEPLYRDGFHLRARFVREHADWVNATVLDSLSR